MQHLLAVACGLESMVVGESQILGQVRQSLGVAREQGTLSRLLSDLGALALRTAKRAHSETGIDRAGANVVGVGIRLAAEHLPTPSDPVPSDPVPSDPVQSDPAASLRGRTVLVVGAGSMSSLAATTAIRMGAQRIVVANRTPDRARRLAAAVSGTTADLDDLPAALADADLVISCTGAVGLVISADDVARALRLRGVSLREAGSGGREAGDSPRRGRSRGTAAWRQPGQPRDVRRDRRSRAGRTGRPPRGRGGGTGDRRGGVRRASVGRARGPSGADRGCPAGEGRRRRGRRNRPAFWPAGHA